MNRREECEDGKHDLCDCEDCQEDSTAYCRLCARRFEKTAVLQEAEPTPPTPPPPDVQTQTPQALVRVAEALERIADFCESSRDES
jgi:hypothetical protein